MAASVTTSGPAPISSPPPSSSSSGSSSQGTITQNQINIINKWITSDPQLTSLNSKLAISIVKHESSGNPNAISSTGCAGLMQICSPVPDILQTTCRQQRPSPTTCENNVPDDRFNEDKNIHAGLRIIQSKINRVTGCTPGADSTKCAIASYNIGEGVINKAITATSQANQQTTWSNVYSHINESILLQFNGYRDGGYFNHDRRLAKIRNLGPYVENIYRDAQ